MNVPMRDFYREVTGHERSIKAMKNDLATWGIPLILRGEGNGQRKYFGVEISHLAEAKAQWELERVKVEDIQRLKPVAHRAAVEQKLDEVLTRIRGLEVALNALMKLAKS